MTLERKEMRWLLIFIVMLQCIILEDKEFFVLIQYETYNTQSMIIFQRGFIY